MKTATIVLSKGYVATIDEADRPFIASFKWHAQVDGRSVYALRNRRDSSGKVTKVAMHRVLLGVTDSTLQVDHIDGDGLNNRRANLRICTRAENQCNSRKQQRQTTSRFKGVSWSARYSKWQACITANGRPRHLGYYQSEIEAARRYNKAAIEMHSQFARLNAVEIAEVRSC